MHLYVGLMVLINKRLDWFAVEKVHILANWVSRLNIILKGHNLVRVLYAQDIQHLPVEKRHVIHLRRLRGKL